MREAPCSNVRVVPDTHDPAVPQFGTRAKFLLGVWSITMLRSTACSSCVGKSCTVLRKKVPFHAVRLEQRAIREGMERRRSRRYDCKGTVAAGGGHPRAAG